MEWLIYCLIGLVIIYWITISGVIYWAIDKYWEYVVNKLLK